MIVTPLDLIVAPWKSYNRQVSEDPLRISQDLIRETKRLVARTWGN